MRLLGGLLVGLTLVVGCGGDAGSGADAAPLDGGSRDLHFVDTVRADGATDGTAADDHGLVDGAADAPPAIDAGLDGTAHDAPAADDGPPPDGGPVGPAACGGAQGIYAAPAGSGSACTLDAPCTLTGARDRARLENGSLAADLIVCLRGGTYQLAVPFALGAQDSGSNGYNVIYRAFPGEPPVISGGRPVTAAWTLHDAGAGIYRAQVGVLATRQLFVGGVRAVRARGPRDPAGFVETAAGYSAPDATMAAWGNPDEIEIVGFREWKSFRCPVASVAGSAITMQQPCWDNAQWHKGTNFDWTMQLPTWIENAYELLDEAGEWYHDRSAGALYYKPRAGEVLGQVEVVVPTLEALVRGAGTLDDPLHHVQLEGLTFAYTTWKRPSTAEGYAALQAGICLVGANRATQKTPAAVVFDNAHAIRLEGNTFIHLGGAGLALDRGCQHGVVIGNRFEDLSGGAIQLGNVTRGIDHHPTDPRQVTKNIAVRGNRIHRVGVEYHDNVGIWAGYVGSVTMLHNELSQLPYTGISVGWGWGSVDPGGSGGYLDPTPARDNHLQGNRIGLFLQVLRDGGGIYVLGAQPGSTMRENYLHHQGEQYAAYYLDNGTQHYTVSGNVAESAPHWLYVQGYETKATNNTVTGNFYDVGSPQMVNPPPDPSNTISNNLAVSGGWPAAAQAAIDAAGLEAALWGPDLAAGQPASASSEWDGYYSAARGNDGLISPGWSPAAPASDPWPWWQVDLGAPRRLGRVELVTRQDLDQPVTRRNFELRASNDPAFASYVVLGGRGPRSLAHQAIWTRLVTAAQSYRYLRVVKTAAEYFFIGELHVRGLPALAATEVARGRPVSASSEWSAGYLASLGNDGDAASGWSPADPASDPRPWWQVDLGSPLRIRRVELVARQELDQPSTRRNFEVWVSNDPTFADYLVLGSQGNTSFAHQGSWSTTSERQTAQRYLRLAKTQDEYFFAAEVRVEAVP